MDRRYEPPPVGVVNPAPEIAATSTEVDLSLRKPPQ